MKDRHVEWFSNNPELDSLLAEQDRQFQEMEKTIEENGIDEEVGWQMYERWLKFGNSAVTEADVTLEGDPHKIIYNPNQQTLFD